LPGRRRLAVEEGAVEVEGELGGDAGVGRGAVSGGIDEWEERDAERIARAAGGARLGDVCSLLLDSGRLGLGGPVGCEVLTRRERAPVVRHESGELLVVLHHDVQRARIGLRQDVLGAGCSAQ